MLPVIHLWNSFIFSFANLTSFAFVFTFNIKEKNLRLLGVLNLSTNFISVLWITVHFIEVNPSISVVCVCVNSVLCGTAISNHSISPRQLHFGQQPNVYFVVFIPFFSRVMNLSLKKHFIPFFKNVELGDCFRFSAIRFSAMLNVVKISFYINGFYQSLVVFFLVLFYVFLRLFNMCSHEIPCLKSRSCSLQYLIIVS